MWKGLLPIGSVVKLHNSDLRFMILSSCVVMESDQNKIYDYCSCYFPDGFEDPDNLIMFNQDDIEDVFCVGYISPEGEEYRKNEEKNLKGLRDGTIKIS